MRGCGVAGRVYGSWEFMFSFEGLDGGNLFDGEMNPWWKIWMRWFVTMSWVWMSLGKVVSYQ